MSAAVTGKIGLRQEFIHRITMQEDARLKATPLPQKKRWDRVAMLQRDLFPLSTEELARRAG